MAKISARGCHKVARATKSGILPDTETPYRTILVLRSDGKVLKAVSFRRMTTGWANGGFTSGERWETGTFTIIGALPERDGRSSLKRFERYCGQRGFTLD